MKKKIVVQEIFPDIYLFEYPNQYQLTSTLIRLQEYYESKFGNIKYKYFTLEDIIDVYSEDNGTFTYFGDWSGFNVPGKAVRSFYKKFFLEHGDLTKKERELFDLIIKNIFSYNKTNNFYIIAIYTRRDINHEFAHAFYYLDKDYKIEINKLISKYKYKKEVGKWLCRMKYSEEEREDEMQAYLSTSSRSYLTSLGFLKGWTIPKEFKSCYQKYKKLWKNKTNCEI